MNTPHNIQYRHHLLALILLLFTALSVRPLHSQAALLVELPVFIFAGQSNMVGLKTSVDDLTEDQRQTQPYVLFYRLIDGSYVWDALTPPTEVIRTGMFVYGMGAEPISGQWSAATTPTDKMGTEPITYGFGPEISTGQRIAATTGTKLVAEIKLAQGGTSLATDWDPNQIDGLYAHLQQRTRSGLDSLRDRYTDHTITVKGFFWMQGESDALQQESAETYQRHLIDFIARVRADVGDPKLPFVLGRIRTGVFPYADQVRQAQEQIARQVPYVALIDTDQLALDPDRTHFTSQGTFQLGILMADAFIAMVQPYRTYLPSITAGLDPHTSQQIRSHEHFLSK